MTSRTYLLALTGLLLASSNVVVRAQADQENFFTHLATQELEDGRPWLDVLSGDFWECMGQRLFSDIHARAEVESVFRGDSAPDEAFFDAGWYCGLFTLAAPWDSGAIVDERDLGAPIRYDTPGITALNQMSGRPAGIEQIADPSAVRLPDGRVALYFAGDHRAAFQSARWVSKEPVNAVTDPISFEIEADYNLPTRLLWRQMFLLPDGRWRAFGNMDGIRSWESVDGLNWVESTTPQVLLPAPSEVRDQLGLPQNALQFNSFLNITRLDDGSWVGVMPHYSEAMDSVAPDPNGNGYNDPPFVLIYHSEDGFTWHYRSVLIGTAEGFVTELSSGIYMFTMSDAVFFSRDLAAWTFGHRPHFHTYGIPLPDGYTLHFGTDSEVGLPLQGFRATIDAASLPDAQWRTMAWENIPSIEELRGLTSGTGAPSQPDIHPAAIEVWPNPASHALTVSWDAVLMGPRPTLQLIDPLGRIVREERLETTGTGRQHYTLPLDNHAGGVFFVRIQGNGFSETRPLIRLE